MALADYTLFLDDEREPGDFFKKVVIARNYEEFCEMIDTRGIPKYISFDHDLGEGKNGKDCAAFLAQRFFDQPEDVDSFRYGVHSMNPIGAENIRAFLENMKRHFADG
ncbi:hypothetical protein [Xanthomonas phage BUDD]|nr:hypothetical protein [Xanthomonas phage BUDD]